MSAKSIVIKFLVLAAAGGALILPQAASAARGGARAVAVTAHGHHRPLGIVFASAGRGHRAHGSVQAHAAGELSGSGPTNGAGAGNMTFHGGSVMHTNTTYSIYWLPAGTTVSAAYRSTIDGFFRNVATASGVNSNVYAVTQQYSDGSGPAQNHSQFGGSYVDTNTPIPDHCSSEYGSIRVQACVTDADIQAEAAHAIAAAGWTPSPTSLFFVFTPRNVGSCFSGSGGICAFTYYCAYHSAFSDSRGHTVLYANQPYTDTSGLGIGGCDPGTHPNGDVADATINVVSHEHIEAITDPLGTGWFDSSGNEIGDKCAWNFGSLTHGTNGDFNQTIATNPYLLQQEWSNNVSGCVQTYTPPVGQPPTVSSLAPTQGGVGTSITITGTNLTGATSVKLNGTAAQFTVTSDTTITATVPDGATTGPITVITPGGTATSTATFTVSYPPPTAASFSPGSGATGTIVTITGTNLAPTTAVAFNGARTTFLAMSNTTLRAFVPGTATTGPITITTPSGSVTTRAAFTIVPSVSSFTPGSGPNGTTVSVTGYNFTGTTAVTIGGVPASSVAVTSATQLTAVVNSADVTGPIAVTAGGQTGSSAGSFAVTPTLTAVAPANAAAGATVTITGANLTGTTAVTFGDVPAASFSVVSPTRVTAVVPARASGGAVSVTTAGGTATAGGSFGVLPKIDAVSPAAASAGQIVTVTGSGLGQARSAAINGAAATIVYDTPTALQLSVPASATSGRVAVTTPLGSATSAGTLTIQASISGYSPSAVRPGATVTINGSGFNGATAVSFNGAARATSFRVVSSTAITAVVPAMALTGGVLVTTPAGVGAGGSALTILPVINSVTRSAGQSGQVTITGGGFMGTSSVKLGGTAVSFTYLNPTTVLATVAASVTSGTFTLTTPAGTATFSGTITRAAVSRSTARRAAPALHRRH